jgi:hypothetical protein
LLKGITGFAEPGVLTALMGGSGEPPPAPQSAAGAVGNAAAADAVTMAAKAATSTDAGTCLVPGAALDGGPQLRQLGTDAHAWQLRPARPPAPFPPADALPGPQALARRR